MKFKTKILKTLPYLIVSILIGVTTVYAGSLTPPGQPSDTMYSLADIFNLSTGTTTDLGSGTIPATPSTVSASGKTLAQVYDAISTEVAKLTNTKIAKDVTVFGFTGTLYGDTDASKVLTSATYAGTMPDNTGASNFTPTTSNQAIPTGFYDGTTAVVGDADLVEENIKEGVNIFGVEGTASGGSSQLTWQDDPTLNLCWSYHTYEIENYCTVGDGFVQTPDTNTTLGALEYCQYLNGSS